MPQIKSDEGAQNNNTKAMAFNQRNQGEKKENMKGNMKRPFQSRPGGGGGGGQQGGFGGFGGGGGGGPKQGGFDRSQGGYDRFQNMSGSTINLETKEHEGSKKLTGRCRLFVGNLTPDTDEVAFRQMFSEFGELSEVFLNSQKGFGFVKLDTRSNAETAKNALDGSTRKGRVLRVRFATHGSAIRVKNLSPYISNELLEKAFSMFGEVERAVVIVDDRGRPMGEGIVEFSRKPGAQTALKRCSDGCFLLCSSPRPVIVEPLEFKDEDDGFPEKNLPRNNQYMKERETGPRFAAPGSFEFEFGNRWKQLHKLEKQKKDDLDKEIQENREHLEEQMEFALYEQETNILREKLRQREEDANMVLRDREMRRREHERHQEEMMRQEEMWRQQGQMKQGDDGMNQGMGRNDEMRRRPDEAMMMQEGGLRQMHNSGNGSNNNIGGMGPGGNMNSSMASSGGFDSPNVDGGIGMGGRGGPMAQRQSRFDQPPQGPGPMGPGNNMDMRMGSGPGGPGRMGPGGSSGPGGPAMNDVRGGMGRREMMDRPDMREEFGGGDIKRRRF